MNEAVLSAGAAGRRISGKDERREAGMPDKTINAEGGPKPTPETPKIPPRDACRRAGLERRFTIAFISSARPARRAATGWPSLVRQG